MDQLDLDARAFLNARGAPITAGNINSIKNFLAANPDMRAQVQATNAPDPNMMPATSNISGSNIPADALDEAVIKSMQPRSLLPREGNTNVAQQRNLRSKTRISGNAQGVNNQSTATTPEAQSAVGAGASAGSVSDAPRDAADVVPAEMPVDQPTFVDPNNPPDAMAGTTSNPSVIDRVINSLLGAAAVGGGAYAASRGRGRAPLPTAYDVSPPGLPRPANAAPALPGGTLQIPGPQTALPTSPARQLPAPNMRGNPAPDGPIAAEPPADVPMIESPGRMVGRDPQVGEVNRNTRNQQTKAVREGRASPVEVVDGRVVDAYAAPKESKLKSAIKSRNTKKKRSE